jgi:hypothetical protein
VRFMRKAMARGAAVVLIATSAVAVEAPALAADQNRTQYFTVSQEHGADYVTIKIGTRYAAVCDQEADGNGVYGEFVSSNGTTTTMTDTNGSQAGCNHATMPSGTYRFRACENNTGCSMWLQWNAIEIVQYNGSDAVAVFPNYQGQGEWLLQACDNEADGNSFAMNWNESGLEVADSNGSAPGCGEIYVAAPQNIAGVTFQGAENREWSANNWAFMWE